MDVSWRMLEPSRAGGFDSWGIGMVDKVIAAIRARGISPVIMLWEAPAWANGSSDGRVGPTSPAAKAALTSLCKRLAQRYRGKVAGWEVWNEPNDNDFLRGKDPATYAGILRAAYAGFKSGDPQSTVVFGGASYVDDGWIGRALATGARGQYDVMGVHPTWASRMRRRTSPTTRPCGG